ncbi:DUF3783 domain-containing protein [Solobacterium sp.]|uniref:DUF3783 domain-containing protein n=1 Tax=Solobacterium sp. TaxID=2060878 RepID=UPI001CAE2DD1|nr:DUF3783 domain-containing protein [Solobacterium sp.]MBF1085140.1 DUF3783 domain-containing protein [Solobacterium sp.]
MKKVIFYGISASATQIYKDILEQMGINMIIIGDDCLSKRFKQVLNMQESTSEVHEKYDGSYLLMDGLSKEEIMIMSESFDGADVPFDGIMVSATQTNREWTLEMIFEEAKQEARIMEQMYHLQMMIELTNGMDLNQLEPEHSAILKRALMDSYLMLMKEEYTYEQISAQARILEEALKGTEHLKRKESHHE